MKKKHCLACLGLLLCAGPLAASCAGGDVESIGSDPGGLEGSAPVAPEPASVGIGPLPQAAGLIVLCHIPPDDPAAQTTIWVSFWAVKDHLAHGDHLGPCVTECLGVGKTCSFDHQCCSGSCQYGVCLGGAGCLPAGDECTFDHQCCSGSCHYGVCESAPGGCLPAGDECTFDHQCCSGSCHYGVCQ